MLSWNATTGIHLPYAFHFQKLPSKFKKFYAEFESMMVSAWEHDTTICLLSSVSVWYVDLWPLCILAVVRIHPGTTGPTGSLSPSWSRQSSPLCPSSLKVRPPVLIVVSLPSLTLSLFLSLNNSHTIDMMGWLMRAFIFFVFLYVQIWPSHTRATRRSLTAWSTLRRWYVALMQILEKKIVTHVLNDALHDVQLFGFHCFKLFLVSSAYHRQHDSPSETLQEPAVQ